MAGEAKTTAQYIEHHLTNLTYGMNPQTGQVTRQTAGMLAREPDGAALSLSLRLAKAGAEPAEPEGNIFAGFHLVQHN